MNPTFKKTLIASSVVMALGAPAAQASLVTSVFGPYAAWTTDSANFTMINPNGGITCCGTNDVSFHWDGDAFTASSDYVGPSTVGNVTASSTTLFQGALWTAHSIQVFAPGTYTFDTTLGGGNAESGILSATVGASQLGMHMLFDWNGNLNIDVFVVANQNAVFGSGLLLSTTTNTAGGQKCLASFTPTTNIVKNCLDDSAGYGSAGKPVKNQIWMLSSADGNGDGLMGIPMAAGGPFGGFNANFNANLTPVPVPAAVWLFGSGLLGLVGIARRKKKISV